MNLRNFTKLESKLLGITPTDGEVVASLWTTGKRKKVAPYQFRKSGRHFNLLGTSRRTFARVLSAMGLNPTRDWVMGNAAPRGGQEGKWVQLTPSGYGKIKRLMVA